MYVYIYINIIKLVLPILISIPALNETRILVLLSDGVLLASPGLSRFPRVPIAAMLERSKSPRLCPRKFPVCCRAKSRIKTIQDPWAPGGFIFRRHFLGLEDEWLTTQHGLPSGNLTQRWNITIFNGKFHYKWPFSIAMLVNQRVFSGSKCSCTRDDPGWASYFGACNQPGGMFCSQMVVPSLSDFFRTVCQWEFQDPKMEVPTIYKAYVRGYNPQNMALYGTVSPF